MKIVHVAIRFPPAEGGGENHVHNLAKQQVRLGHAVHVITTDLMKEVPRIADKKLPKEDSIDGIHVIRKKTYPTLLPIWGYGSLFFGLKKELDRIDPDIVHAHSYGYFHSDKVARLRKNARWKLVMTSHGFIPGRGALGPLKKIYERLVGVKTVGKLDAAIAISRHDEAIFKNMGASRVVVVPNGIDREKFENLPPRETFRAAHGITGTLLLNVGRLAEVKGQRILIEAFKGIATDFPDTTLVIVGADWGEEAALRDLVRRFSLEKRILFTGSVDEKTLLEAYAAADVFAHTPRDEPFGIVLLEAMACGIPIIATSVGGIPDVVGDAAILTGAQPNEISTALKKVLSDKDLRERLSADGRKRATQFEWKNMAKKIEQVYIALLENGVLYE